MTRSSLRFLTGFSVKFFFQPIYTDCANQAYFDKRSRLNLLNLKLLNQIKPNMARMVPRWVPFKIVSDSPTFHSKWLLLLKIVQSNVQFYIYRALIINGTENDANRLIVCLRMTAILLRCSSIAYEGPRGSISQVVGLPNNSYKPITNTAWVRARLCRSQKEHSTRSRK